MVVLYTLISHHRLPVVPGGRWINFGIFSHLAVVILHTSSSQCDTDESSNAVNQHYMLHYL